jgi:hypothetical protein
MGSEALFERSDSAVNNFAQAEFARRGHLFMLCSGWGLGTISSLAISRTGRPGLLTTGRFDDFELNGRSAGRVLTPERLAQRPLNYERTLLYWRRPVKTTAGSAACQQSP